MNPVTARLLSQQLICPQFTKPEEVVSWFGAMQGQEYRMVRWAVAMRTKSPSLKAFEKAFNGGADCQDTSASLHLATGCG